MREAEGVQDFLGGGGLKNRSMLVKNCQQEGGGVRKKIIRYIRTCNLALPTPVNESTGAFVQIK